jgi:hypothetical protein
MDDFTRRRQQQIHDAARKADEAAINAIMATMTDEQIVSTTAALKAVMPYRKEYFARMNLLRNI